MKINDFKSLKVKFNEIPQGGLRFHFTDKTHELDEALKDLRGAGDNYKVELNLDTVEDLANLKGHISGTLPLTCSRCAEDFSSSYDKKFALLFYKNENAIENITGDAVGEGGLDALDSAFDLECISGNEINLGETVHEQIALEIPFQPLCSENCKGLCSQCGANLNMVENHSHKEVEEVLIKSSPFAKLKELRRGE